MAEPIANPILNSPYEAPTRHFEIGPSGPTGVILAGRRPSESYIPIPATRKVRRNGDGVQQRLDFDITGERRERNTLINDLRREIERWRGRDYERATPISRKLMQHWADPRRENRVLFCQREAAETAIFLAEVAGRHGYSDWRVRLGEANDEHNAGLPRIAMKMATGSGKTVVMAMLIAWHTLNKVYAPRDSRFTNRFLVITPGITIRDRLRVLRPGDPENYYRQRDLIPPDLLGALQHAVIGITNYHAFLPRMAKEMKGVSSNTRKLLVASKPNDPFKESPDAVVARVLRDLGMSGSTVKNEIVILNDEAHHCYQERSVANRLSREEDEANEEARVWFRGIQALASRVGVKQIYDLSATPFYLSGSGRPEGLIFGWTVSDFSLMDAIESGIVKVPRIPVDDDAAGNLVSYLMLWQHVGDQLPRRKSKGAHYSEWDPPRVLQGALNSLYTSYQRAFRYWEANRESLGETPPVFIVVCPNTLVSKLVYDWIAGRDVEVDGALVRRAGNLALFSNVEDGTLLARPRTILVDSAQLESGEVLKGDFKEAAAAEITSFKTQYRLDHPGADVDKLTDADILREVMNTVGKPGMLGAEIRCVVSVAMLTEGWDANTVTHILGIRAFNSQLLCEQVVGRGLRRRSYVANDDGLFEPEYANIYGIPFAFIPSDRAIKESPPARPALEVHAVRGREHLRIWFPKLDGYRIELPDDPLHLDLDALRPFVIGEDEVPTWTETAPVVGVSERVAALRDVRPQEVAFHMARCLLVRHFELNSDRRPWLFPQLARICSRWVKQCVEVRDGRTIGCLLTNAELQNSAAEDLMAAIVRQVGSQRGRLRAMLRPFDSVGSTGDVRFLTRKAHTETDKSEVSHVVYDGADGNTWEQIVALECELNPSVAAYVKNDHLGFAIPYVHLGRTHSYVPDFLLRLRRADGEDIDRTLIVEVSGRRKDPGPTREKARTAKEKWVPAVNNHGGFGRWGFVEVIDMNTVRDVLNGAIDNLYNDAAIIGDEDLLDFRARRGA
ncbi:BPTD_3080 family restriction endonuclease [Mycobacterium riyadhense]|uniref:Restriction endonuclease n=1 Tax=Mycobacterium riyadhense TaxID=486698 RepID=A0A1X2CIN9_9MYCO|nr:DEAD/DEAH box helicase family protein [Mycobacterium riyadhense]MCV7147543.1 DEAD/DEAH box helicase family protein [Mycobacterium riyadhense]ORW75800.1 restriction endonuclease [Mycobacterium riyadhense]